MSKVIFHIEDDEADHLALRRRLVSVANQIDLIWVNSGNAFLDFLKSDLQADMIILDYQFPGFSLTDIVSLIRESKHNNAKLVGFTAFQPQGFRNFWSNLGVLDVFLKDQSLALSVYIERELDILGKEFIADSFRLDPILDKLINKDFYAQQSGNPVLIMHTPDNSIVAWNAFAGLKMSNTGNLSREGVSIYQYFRDFDLPFEMRSLFLLAWSNNLEKGSYSEGQTLELVIESNDPVYKVFSFKEIQDPHLQKDMTRRMVMGAFIGLNEPLIIINNRYQIEFYNTAFTQSMKGFPELRPGMDISGLFKPARWELVLAELKNFRTSGPGTIVFQVANSKSDLYQIEASVSFIPKAEGYYCILLRSMKPVEQDPLPARSYPLTYPLYLPNIIQISGEATFVLDSQMHLLDYNKSGKHFLNEHLFQRSEKGEEIRFDKIAENDSSNWKSQLLAGFQEKRSFPFSSGGQQFEILVFPLSAKSSDQTQNILVFAVNIKGAESFEALEGLPIDLQATSSYSEDQTQFQFDNEGKLVFLNGVWLKSNDELEQERIKEKSTTINFDDFYKLINTGEQRNKLGFASLYELEAGERILRYYMERLMDAKGRKIGIRGYFSDISDQVRLSRALEKNTRILKRSQDFIQLILEAQTLFIETNNIRSTFDLLLTNILNITGCEFGLIAEVLFDDDGTPFMRSLSVTYIGWDAASREFFRQNIAKGLEFRNLNSLYGQPMVTGQPFITNVAKTHPNRGGTPKGHPEIRSFAGLPVKKQGRMTAILGLANHPKGFTQDFVESMEPLLAIMGTILDNHRMQRVADAAKEKLAKSEGRIKSVLQSMDILVIELNPDFEILSLWCNEKWKLNWAISSVIGKDIRVLPDFFEDTRKVTEILELVNKDGQSRSLQYSLKLGDKERWYEAFFHLLLDTESGNFCIVIKDITRRKQAELDMFRSLQSEKELAELKSRFINMTSHEFRTPLTSISSSNELIRMLLVNEGLGKHEKLHKYFKIIQSEVARMVNLMNDVLLLGKIGTENTTVNSSAVDLIQFIEETIMKLVSIQRIPETVNLVVKGMKRPIETDTKLLDHILDNLLNNAFKYSPERPTPKVVVNFESEEVTICVEDQGIGIPSEDLPRLFVQFYRASNSEKIQGIGLGLVIVKRLTELLGGTIEITSKIGQGTKACITFPYNSKKAIA